jgi:hypothetical protein
MLSYILSSIVKVVNTMEDPRDPLLHFQPYFTHALNTVQRYGARPSATLRLKEGVFPLPMYDFGEEAILIPGTSTTAARLSNWLMRGLLLYQDETSFNAMLQALAPWILAHELCHHLRAQHGRWTGDLWHDEEIATELAAAYVLAYHPTDALENHVRYLLQSLRPKERAASAERMPILLYVRAQVRLISGALARPTPRLEQVLAQYIIDATVRS